MIAIVTQDFKTHGGHLILKGTIVYILPASWIAGIYLFQIGKGMDKVSIIHVTHENYFEKYLQEQDEVLDMINEGNPNV